MPSPLPILLVEGLHFEWVADPDGDPSIALTEAGVAELEPLGDRAHVRMDVDRSTGTIMVRRRGER